jgi:cell division protease FtsH
VCAGSILLWSVIKYPNLLGLSKPQPDTIKKVLFSDIYGNDDIKEKLNEFIDYLKNPIKYKEIGARTRKGILLYGPPGTGKTMIAKATACESGVDFLYCSAAEFQEIYVGVGPKRIR